MIFFFQNKNVFGKDLFKKKFRKQKYENNGKNNK